MTAVFGWKGLQDAPEGYGFDFVNSDVLLHKITVKDGRLVTPGGTSYRILYLGGRSQRMPLPVLQQLKSFVEQGAVIVGSKPTDSPSLADDETVFHRIADQLWGPSGQEMAERGKQIPGKMTSQSATYHKFGKGRVYSGMTTNQVLADLKISRDFEYTKPNADTNLMFLHRKLDEGDVYFVDNRNDRVESVNATFRIDGKIPELWDAGTGVSKPVSYRIADGRTTVPLQLDPYGSVFVIFRAAATTGAVELREAVESPVAGVDDALNKDWSVSFQPGRGAPETVAFDRLTSWSESPIDGVKYFSGTATYSKAIQVPEGAIKVGAHVWLDLGDVKDVAEVAVNGKYLGILWKTPFKVDITGALQTGSNQIVIEVTNLWVNRLIGDQQPYALKKYTFTDITPYKADAPLLPSGLLGPVRMISVDQP